MAGFAGLRNDERRDLSTTSTTDEQINGHDKGNSGDNAELISSSGPPLYT